MRRLTSGLITISSGQRLSNPSSFHFRVASMPILYPRQGRGARVVELVERAVHELDVAFRVDRC